MSNEDIKDLLQMIKTCSKNLDSKLTFDSGCCKCLLEYIDGLKERIEYLERSNNRREITIQEEREENQELVEKYNIRSKTYNNILLENASLHNKIDKAIEIIEGCNLGIFDYSIDQIGIIELLKILKDSDVDE